MFYYCCLFTFNQFQSKYVILYYYITYTQTLCTVSVSVTIFLKSKTIKIMPDKFTIYLFSKEWADTLYDVKPS